MWSRGVSLVQFNQYANVIVFYFFNNFNCHFKSLFDNAEVVLSLDYMLVGNWIRRLSLPPSYTVCKREMTNAIAIKS